MMYNLLMIKEEIFFKNRIAEYLDDEVPQAPRLTGLIVANNPINFIDVGDHENGPKTNHGGSVGDVTTRGNLLKENIVLPRWI